MYNIYPYYKMFAVTGSEVADKIKKGIIPQQYKEARGSFSGLKVEVLKLQSRVQDKLRSPSYYIIISTYDQS